jgi:integrase
MYKAFRYDTDAGAYWSVIDDDTYDRVDLADRFLQYMRFARGRAESTTRKYAEAIALYHRYCISRGRCWDDPDITAFQFWLKVAPSPLQSRSHGQVWAGPGHRPIRNNNRINLITYAVCEMFKFAAAEGIWPEAKLTRLFETIEVSSSGRPDRRRRPSATVVLRRRHRLRPKHSRRRDVPVDVVKQLLAECHNARDVLLLAVLATTGLRRGEALGLRLCDLHFLPTSASLGCAIDGPHLHVLPRHNSNHARVKNDKSRTVPVTAELIALYERYRTERDECRLARESDFVFVNLYRQPLGEPMKLHAANELMDRLSRRLGQTVTPHMLRHTFGTGAAATTTLDVVAELLGHATCNPHRSTVTRMRLANGRR